MWSGRGLRHAGRWYTGGRPVRSVEWDLPTRQPINWTNAVTLISVGVLVGTELVGAGSAAGWAIGGLFQLGDTATHGLEIVLIMLALVGLFYFLRAALSHEPIRG